MIDSFINALLPFAFWAIERTNRKTLLKALSQPEQTQLRLLKSIIAKNSQTEFGRDHNFIQISDWQTYREHVPINTYESISDYVARQVETGDNSIVASKIVTLARTSGSTGAAKDIPTTADSLAAIKDAQCQTALTLFQKTRFFDGKVLAMYSSHVEGRHPSGMAYGSSSGQANRNTSLLMKSKFAFPHELTSVGDYDLKYYLYTLFGILQPNVTGIAAANPSSVCRIAEIIKERHTELATDLQTGNIWRLDKKIPEAVIKSFATLHKANRRRAADLALVLEAGGEHDLGYFWPNLSSVVAWTGGSCGVALERLKTMVSSKVKFVELGYRASEFIGSVNLNADQNICVPTIHNTVFEFVEQSNWESEQYEFTPISKLQVGKNYYVIVTTPAGLYRYNINDVIQVTGYYGDCPSIQFLQKGKGITSITGEKLYLHQVAGGVANAQAALGISLESFLVLADEDNAVYQVYLETKDATACDRQSFSDKLDTCLQNTNIEYAEKRKSGRLKSPNIHFLKIGTGDAIKRQALKSGQRESQYKPICLAYVSSFKFDLDPWLIQ